MEKLNKFHPNTFRKSRISDIEIFIVPNNNSLEYKTHLKPLNSFLYIYKPHLNILHISLLLSQKFKNLFLIRFYCVETKINWTI